MAAMKNGLRATARALGMQHSYLSRLATEGKVPRNSDGSFDLAAVRAAIDAQTDPALVRSQKRSPGGPSVTSDHFKKVTTPDEAREAVALVARVLKDEGIAPDGAVDFPKARLAETILKARDRNLRIAERSNALVPLDKVKAHVSAAFIGFRRAIEGMPARYVAQIAANVGCDAGVLNAELERMIHETLAEQSAPIVRAS